MKKGIFIVALFGGITLNAQSFTLKSNELGGQASQKQVFNGYGCNGKNLSPELFWENPPEGTKSFAVTIFDGDAPAGSGTKSFAATIFDEDTVTGNGWWHWLIFDIPSKVKELKSGAGNLPLNLAPNGSIQSNTDFKTQGYGGPCPPEGSKPHKYVVTVYALKIDKLGIDATANPAFVAFKLEQHVIEKSSLIFYYKR